MKAPKSLTDTTLPVYIFPSFASSVKASIASLAASAPVPAVEAMKIVPSFSMSIVALVSSWILLIIFPPGPMTFPIFSGSILIVNIRGA